MDEKVWLGILAIVGGLVGAISKLYLSAERRSDARVADIKDQNIAALKEIRDAHKEDMQRMIDAGRQRDALYQAQLTIALDDKKYYKDLLDRALGTASEVAVEAIEVQRRQARRLGSGEQ